MAEQEYFDKVEVGHTAPDFIAEDVNGDLVNLKSLIGDEKIVLLFYRGGWCPMCKKQLASLSKDYSLFKNINTRIVVVSSERIENGRKLVKKIGLPFVLLSDPDFEVIERYGVKTEKRDLLAKMKRVQSYATPSVFIIDEKGIIRYKYVGRDAGDRPKNDELLEKLREIN